MCTQQVLTGTYTPVILIAVMGFFLLSITYTYTKNVGTTEFFWQLKVHFVISV